MARRAATTPRQVAFLNDFSKGLVTNRPITLLAPNEAQVAENLDLSLGYIRRRSGWTQLHDDDLPSGTTEPVYGLFTKFDPAGDHLLLATADTSLMKSSGAEFSTVGTITGSAPIRPTFAQVLDTVYIAYREGADQDDAALLKTDGTTVSAVSGGPTGSLVYSHAGALWVSGNDDDPNRVYWSSQAPDHETWPAANFLDVDPTQGDSVTGLAKVQGALVVLKQFSVHRIVGQPPDDASLSTGDLAVHSYRGERGCIAPRSVAVNKNAVFYLNDFGIYSFDGIKTTEVTKDIRPLFADLKDSDKKHAVGAFIEEDHYVLSVTTSASHEPNLVISIRLSPQFSINLWRGLPLEDLTDGYTRNNLSVYSFGQWPDADQGLLPVLGFAGKVGLMDGSPLDNDERIRWVYRTGAIPMGSPQGQQFIRRGWLSANQGTGQVEVRFFPDFKTDGVDPLLVDSTVLRTAYGESASTVPIPAIGSARRWAVEFAGESNNFDPAIYELTLEYFTKFRF